VVGVMGLESRRIIRSAVTVGCSRHLTRAYYITKFPVLQAVFGILSSNTLILSYRYVPNVLRYPCVNM
jgi:hypothetical protein